MLAEPVRPDVEGIGTVIFQYFSQLSAFVEGHLLGTVTYFDTIHLDHDGIVLAETFLNLT